MKNAIALFIKEHPIMTFVLVVEVAGAARDTVVGIARAITGKYPPKEQKPEPAPLPKVDITIQKPKKVEETEEPTTLNGEVTSEDDLSDILD